MRTIITAAALCLAPCAPLLAADTIILRCEAQGEITFSVSIDPIAHALHSVGFATKVETNQFSDSVIEATSKEVTSSHNLVIDRITGQFQLSWGPARSGEKGGSYQGSCVLARRLF